MPPSKRDVERSDRAPLSVNLSAVYRSAFSYETLTSIILWHFLVSFLPLLAIEDLRRATYPDMCVNGSKDRESVCHVGQHNPQGAQSVEWREPEYCKSFLICTLNLYYTKGCLTFLGSYSIT